MSHADHPPPAAATPSLGPDAARAIEADALATYERYLLAFNARDAARAARFYGVPMMVVRATGHRMLAAHSEVETMLSNSLALLQTKGFASTRIGRCTLRAMNENTVLLSADFIRSRADGSVIETVACTYVLSRGDSGWAIVTMVAHPADRVLPGLSPSDPESL